MEIEGNIMYYVNGENLTYSIASLIDVKKDKYVMTCLNIYNGTDPHDEGCFIESWDNDTYLSNNLYKGLLVDFVNEKKIKNVDVLNELIQIKGFSINDLEPLKNLLSLAIEKGLLTE